jgi:hypothetical protein
VAGDDSEPTLSPMTAEEREKYERDHALHIERQKLMGVPEREWAGSVKLTASTTTVTVKG